MDRGGVLAVVEEDTAGVVVAAAAAAAEGCKLEEDCDPYAEGQVCERIAAVAAAGRVCCGEDACGKVDDVFLDLSENSHMKRRL